MAASDPSPYLLTPIDNVMARQLVSKLLYFPESENSDVPTVVETFRRGLSKTLEAIPLLSGTLQVIGQGGALCVTAPWSTVDDIFQVKDVSHEGGPEYRDLKYKQFPMEALDRKIFLPLAGLLKSEKPVMLVQVTIIKGGIIMALCMHHSFTDGNGTAAIARVWAAYCRGDDGSRLVTQEMISRERLMRGWESATLADVPEYTLMPMEKQVSSGGVLSYIYSAALDWLPAPLHWLTARLRRWALSTKNPEANPLREQSQIENAIFFFPKSSLVELKSMACAREHGEEDDVWVSTNDALCALLACCVHSEMDKDIRIMADRSCVVVVLVGGRRMLNPPLPADYIGNVVSWVRLVVPSHSIDSTPAKVAEIARLIRDQIKQRDERYFRKMISALSSVRDLPRVIATPPSPSEAAFSFSSWANQSFYDMDWGDGVGAKIERVRLRTGVKDFCIIMPELGASSFAGEDCGLEVTIGLEKGQMGRLKQNELLMRFAQFRCN